ncbi:LuxR C-terminal-related transcriptional regulator [Microbacterium excoecariae]|uniref:LuxR C-terminal-related transcriptional regulator n=1 Tax=Microbacterium excoecariae TaxID=2715210 RepID=UPI00140CB01E|nr:LuxR C-terminal-related transcriptional regulator [Microbacterium excoecariae]NHI17881.1 helix-turn-helix transcriptional regulator [Microbacterium excoecariae]
MSATPPGPNDQQLLARAVEEFAAVTRFPLAFGGLADEDQLTRVTRIVGNRTGALAGLAVAPDRGLGGRAVAEARPRMTGDYATARQITHDYDGFILGEGIGTLIAVPVVVAGRPRGLLYGGAWGSSTVGGVAAAPAVGVAERLASALAERPSALEDTRNAPGPLPAAQREELRATYAELRLIAAEVDDAGLRGRLAAVERRLAALSADAPPRASEIRLAPREVDVLACAALGATNAEIAERLGLREATVKAYLASAMSRLDASTRHAAVAAARRHGLLP